MQDFTLTTYKKLLQGLLNSGYSFQTLQEYIQNPKEKVVILRHDVDRLPENALKMAHMENTIGIKTSYFFRTVDQVFDETIIEKIVSLGHEIGYHYENLSEISRKPEVRSQKTEGRGRLATDAHRRTQTFVRRTSPDKRCHRFAKKRSLEINFLNCRLMIFD